ncbi:MAG: acyl carrier protein [Opitutales bacterium]
MTHQDVEQKVTATIARKLEIEPSTIHADTRLAEDLGIDSFGAVELLFEIEEAFGLKIPDSEIEHVRTVGHIVDYIDHWLAKPDPGLPSRIAS